MSHSWLKGFTIFSFFIKSIASFHHFFRAIASSCCVKVTPGDTLVHTLVHDKYSPTRWVSRKLRPKCKTIPCLLQTTSSRLVYCSLIQCPICECIWFCSVTDLYCETVTQHTSCQRNGSVWNSPVRMAFKSSSVIN